MAVLCRWAAGRQGRGQQVAGKAGGRQQHVGMGQVVAGTIEGTRRQKVQQHTTQARW